MQTNDASSTAVADMPRLSALLRRWPTALGFGVAALMLSDFEDGARVRDRAADRNHWLLADRCTGAPTSDLVGSRWPTSSSGLSAPLNIPPEPVFAVVAVAVIIFGLVRGSLRRLWLPALQAPATLLFGTVAFSEQAQR
jgi:hypothetical protein